MNHKRLRKFLDENNHHLNEIQFIKRSKTNSAGHTNKEENLNLRRNITSITRADSGDAWIAENEKRKDLSEENLDDLKIKNDITEDIERRIEELFLSKIELPSSSLNRSMSNSLDQIYNLLEKIDTNKIDFYEVINFLYLASLLKIFFLS